VKLLAQALGWSPAWIYGYCGVAKAWPTKRAFDKLVERMGKCDKPLSWSQVVLLATVTDAKRQAHLLADALEHGWSDSRLKREMSPAPQYPFKVLRQASANGAHAAAQSGPLQPKAPREVLVALENYRTQLVPQGSSLDVFGSRLDHLVAEVHPADISPNLIEPFEQVKRELEDSYRARVKQLSEWIAQLEKARNAAQHQDEMEEGVA
jgi:hypothetical protein